MGHSLAIPQKVKHTVTIWSSNSTSRYIHMRNENISPRVNLYTNIHSSIIHNVETIQTSINGWMDEQTWYTHTMRYYLAIKKDGVLIHVTTQMNLKNIMLSGRSQIQKVTCCMIQCIWNIQNRQIQRQNID